MLHKKVIFLSGLIMIFANSLLAKDSDSTKVQSTNAIHKGSKALQFQIGRNFTLKSFQGSLISYKRFFSEKSAIRIGIGLYSDQSTQKSIREQPPVDTLKWENKRNYSHHRVTMVSQYVIYPIKNYTWFYYGIGPKFSYSHTYSRSEDIATIGSNISTRTSEIKGNYWSFGVSGVIGSEWFMRNYLSLHAEYGLSFMYSTSKTSRTDSDSSSPYDMETETKSKSYDLSSGAVKFGLSGYF